MESYRGTRSLQSFSPIWTDPEILEQTLIGRKALVDRLEELTIDGAGGPNKHQRLIVGVRGSGKTHVLKVLHNRLWQNEEIKKRLLIIYPLEDELGVASFLDFVVRLLRAIVRWYPEHEQLSRDLDALYDLPLDMQEARAVQLLLATADDKDVLILMENLGITFDKTQGFGRRGQQALRDLIQKYPRFMIFASSQALFQATQDEEAPFYQFFKVIHLRRLKLEEALQFLEMLATATDKTEMVRFLNTPKGRARMRAIYAFTGGNHRLLVTFYEVLAAESLARLSEPFIKALNPLKPYYQEQMRSLSAQQQKIVQFLALERQPLSVKKIARGCLAAPNTISSQLKDLLEKNYVSRIEQGRESYYEITEALFRICYEADLEQEGAPVRLFVDFLANLYTARELQLRWRGFGLLAAKLGNKGAVPFANAAKLYASALAQRYPELATKAELSPASSVEPKQDLLDLIHEMEQAGAYREILDLSRHLGKERDAFVLHTEAGAYAHLGDAEKARTSALQALEKDPCDMEAHLVLADVLSLKKETLETGLGHARHACELAPDDPQPMAGVGKCLTRSGKLEEALAYLETLTLEHPDYAEGWTLIAHVLRVLDRREETESAYRKALELDPKNTDALRHHGMFVGVAGRHEEALKLFQRLNEAAPDDSDGWSLTAWTLIKMEQNSLAESLCRKALELDPKNADDLKLLGILLGSAGRYEDALELFQRLNAVAPDDLDGWNLKAMALDNLGRTTETDTACRTAINLDRGNWIAWVVLMVILLRLDREQDSSKAFEKALALGADAGFLIYNRGEARRSHGQYELAIADYEEALQADPEAMLPQFNIVSALLGLGRIEDALDRLTKALNAVKKSKPPKSGLVMQSIQENCQELFEHAPTQAFGSYLERALEIIREKDYLEQFEASLPLTVFAILKDHENIGEERFTQIIRTFEEVIGKRTPVSVAVRFLQVGIDHFKKQDRKALLRLTREERRTFCEELGIENR